MAILYTMFVLKVHDIVNMKHFYQEVLALGTPVLDSNFWVEFQLSETTSFCLEQKENISVPTDDKQCLFEVSSIQDFLKRYCNCGYKISEDLHVSSIFGIKVYSFLDPENNIFYIMDCKKQ